ncbi:hypothetical protein Plhal304r1_c014g0052431 [Plasmopara halstedii]
MGLILVTTSARKTFRVIVDTTILVKKCRWRTITTVLIRVAIVTKYVTVYDSSNIKAHFLAPCLIRDIRIFFV